MGKFGLILFSARLKYPQLQATTVLAGFQDRVCDYVFYLNPSLFVYAHIYTFQVIESAQWFAQGYFGRQWAALNATSFCYDR